LALNVVEIRIAVVPDVRCGVGRCTERPAADIAGDDPQLLDGGQLKILQPDAPVVPDQGHLLDQPALPADVGVISDMDAYLAVLHRQLADSPPVARSTVEDSRVDRRRAMLICRVVSKAVEGAITVTGAIAFHDGAGKRGRQRAVRVEQRL